MFKRETDRCLCSTQPARLPFILPNAPPRSSRANTVTQQWLSHWVLIVLPHDWLEVCVMWGTIKERYGTMSDVINSPWISQCHRNRKPFFRRGAHGLSSSEEIAFNGMFCMCTGIHSILVQKPLEENAGLIVHVQDIQSRTTDYGYGMRHFVDHI